MRLKIFLIFILLSLLIILCNLCCYAENNDLEKHIEDNINNLDLTEFDQYLNELDSDYFKDNNIKALINSVINGNFNGNINDFFKLLVQIIKNGLLNIIPGILGIISIALIYSILGNFSSNFLNSSIKNTIYFVCYVCTMIIILNWVYQLVSISKTTISNMQKFMEIVFPILLTMITILGGVTTVSVYKPLMSALTTLISKCIVSIIIPLFVATIIVTLVSNISKNYKLDKLSKLIKSCSTFILTIMFSVFMTFLSFQGISSGVIDTISIKTAKFALSSYVPVLGGYLSDGFDLVLASIVLIKNSIGVVSIIVLLISVIYPVIKIVLISFLFKVTSAIVEPIAGEEFSSMLYKVSKNINLLISAIVGVFVMFIVTVMLIIYTCNLGVI